MESNLTERLDVVMENTERDSQDVLDVEVSGTESFLRDFCPAPDQSCSNSVPVSA